MRPANPGVSVDLMWNAEQGLELFEKYPIQYYVDYVRVYQPT